MRNDLRFRLVYLMALLVMIQPLAHGDEEAAEESAEPETPAVSIFPDKNLEAVVRKYVFEKRNNEDPITAEDVENISTIEGPGAGIKDLTGLEHCISLALLNLEDNEVADLEPIRELTDLQSLTLSKNQIDDIEPLAGLIKLQLLDLSDNQVSNLAPLTAMENMRSLYLSGNRLSDLGPVASLTKVWSLYIDRNEVDELDPLENLKWLSSLDIRNNKVRDLSPLSKLTELRYLIASNNLLEDLGVLLTMAEKDASGEQRFAPFWNIYVGGNPLAAPALRNQIPSSLSLAAASR